MGETPIFLLLYLSVTYVRWSFHPLPSAVFRLHQKEMLLEQRIYSFEFAEFLDDFDDDFLVVFIKFFGLFHRLLHDARCAYFAAVK